MLMPAHSFVNTALILLNHVIRYAALASKFGDNRKYVSLYCVFHSIRFKVNKDWLSGIDSLFLCL